MRRAVGLLTMIFLLHLSLAAGDFACASHGDHTVHGEQSARSHAGMQMTTHRESAPTSGSVARGENQEHCATPVTSDCCTAMASCATVFFSSAPAEHLVPTHAKGRPLSDLLVPTTSITGPETPPPRA